METVSSQRICPSCGTVNNEVGKFCIKCGNLLPINSSPTLAENAGASMEAISKPMIQPVKRQGKIAYQPQIIEQFAIRLYRTAKVIMVLFTLIGFLGGGAGGYIFGGGVVLGIGGAILMGGFLFWISWEIAFRLKLRAQLALCQVQIEENIR